MDFDRGSRDCAALWNTQTALRIQCLFASVKIHLPSPTGCIYEESAVMFITRLIYETP